MCNEQFVFRLLGSELPLPSTFHLHVFLSLGVGVKKSGLCG